MPALERELRLAVQGGYDITDGGREGGLAPLAVRSWVPCFSSSAGIIEYVNCAFALYKNEEAVIHEIY